MEIALWTACRQWLRRPSPQQQILHQLTQQTALLHHLCEALTRHTPQLPPLPTRRPLRPSGQPPIHRLRTRDDISFVTSRQSPSAVPAPPEPISSTDPVDPSAAQP